MTDSHGRTIDYMRVSVTDRCNLRCMYCMPKKGVKSVPHGEVLTLEEILRLCGVFAGLGIKKIKVTGGEPLVRGGVAGFIGELKRIPGVEKVTLTTNGLLLEKNLPALAAAGIDGVNVSLDTLSPAVYKELTGSDGHDRVMGAISACAGTAPVKINCVPVKGVNELEIAAIAGLARGAVAAVRFIELMPVGLGAKYGHVAAGQIKAALEAEYGKLKPCAEKLGNGPARYYSADGFSGRIGIISAVSHEFCGGCNRVRLTSLGWLKLCLARDDGVSLRDAMRGGASDGALAEMILEAVARKPGMHGFADAAHGTMMNGIGG